MFYLSDLFYITVIVNSQIMAPQQFILLGLFFV